jgi:hypothetical protein
MNNVIELTPAELDRCWVFCRKVAKTQQTIEFGESAFNRSTEEVARDSMIGRVAEVAFQKWVKINFKLGIKLDWEIKPRKEWDAEDARVGDITFDIKGTRKGGRFLLVEENKLNFRKKEDNIPSYFVFVTCGWDREKDEPLGDAEIHGFCDGERLSECPPRFPVFEVKKGLPLFLGGPILQATNRAVEGKNLRTDWENMR